MCSFKIALPLLEAYVLILIGLIKQAAYLSLKQGSGIFYQHTWSLRRATLRLYRVLSISDSTSLFCNSSTLRPRSNADICKYCTRIIAKNNTNFWVNIFSQDQESAWLMCVSKNMMTSTRSDFRRENIIFMQCFWAMPHEQESGNRWLNSGSYKSDTSLLTGS